VGNLKRRVFKYSLFFLNRMNHRGLTFADLMIGMAILMIGIALLSLGLGVTRKSTLGTRESIYMGNLALDVANRIMENPDDISAILRRANEREDVNQNVKYKIEVVTRKKGETPEEVDVIEYKFVDGEVTQAPGTPEVLKTDLMKVNVIVTYETIEAGVENEDDRKYELSFFVEE
jgi:hypothetical protein